MCVCELCDSDSSFQKASAVPEQAYTSAKPASTDYAGLHLRMFKCVTGSLLALVAFYPISTAVLHSTQTAESQCSIKVNCTPSGTLFMSMKTLLFVY